MGLAGTRKMEDRHMTSSNALLCGKEMNTQADPPAPESARTRAQFGAARLILQNAIAARAFPGCAFGVLAGGEVVVEEAVGRFTYEEDAPVVTRETVYDVASLTKVAATTAMAMLLHQRGQIDLEAPLGDLLPGFVAARQPGNQARRVTLRHLLAHNSGLPGYVEFFKTATTPDSLVRACLQLPLEAEPGTRAEYCEPGFILLGKALEVAAGESLGEWARREIFQRIGMAQTQFRPTGTTGSSLIPPTEEDTTFRHRRIQGEVQDENAWVLGGVAGHAGIFSNVPDLLRLAQRVLKTQSVDDASAAAATLFDRATIELFATRQPPEGSSCALGWDTPSENSSSGKHFSRRSIGHLGFSGCSLWIDLEAEVAIVLLTNRTWPDRQNQLIKTVRPAFHDAVREAL
jgi:CubicO group peptidase (beta-lactamase class C family)